MENENKSVLGSLENPVGVASAPVESVQVTPEQVAPVAQPTAVVPVQNPAEKSTVPEWAKKIEKMLPFSFWVSVAAFLAVVSFFWLFFAHRSWVIFFLCMASAGVLIGKWEVLKQDDKNEQIGIWGSFALAGFVFFLWLVLKLFVSYGAGGFWGY